MACSSLLVGLRRPRKSLTSLRLLLTTCPLVEGEREAKHLGKRKKQESATNRIDRLATDQTGSNSSTYNIQAATYSPYNYVCTMSPSTSWTPLYSDWSPDSYMLQSMLPSALLPPPSLPPPPPPMAEATSPFNLCFISGNIAKCAGCNNKYVKPVTAPYELCVQHREWSHTHHQEERSFLLLTTTLMCSVYAEIALLLTSVSSLFLVRWFQNLPRFTKIISHHLDFMCDQVVY